MGKSIWVSGFPFQIPAERVKKIFEQITGKGTVAAVEIHLYQGGPTAYAIVQFINSKCARGILSLPQYFLKYPPNSILETSKMNDDIVTNPRRYEHEMEEVSLHFGCQISAESFAVLWRGTNVSVKFGTGMRGMYFFLWYDSVEYKLQLSYENICNIVLHCPHDQAAKILIKLSVAPRIYKKLDNSLYSYFKETPDDQWVRTTDFTSSCIGQSSGVCLELPCGLKIPNCFENFVCCKESETPLCFESSDTFSHKLTLVPILLPPMRIELPYKILFKICSLVQTGCLPGPRVDAKFYRLVNPRKIDIRYIEHALDKLYYSKECCYDPVSWISGQYEKCTMLREPPKSHAIRLDDGLIYVHRVQVTPTKVYFCGPEVNMSNRVLRHYRDDIDNFLRVSFVDEELDKLYSMDLSPRVAGYEKRRTKIYNRILSTLREGIKIGDKRFDFLAFSASQLHENSVWMFAATTNHTAGDIRRWMGDFRSIRNVAKYAARLGQSFGSSIETLSLDAHEIELIPDIKALTNRTNYVFSDGIGKISSDFAQTVAKKCGFGRSIPSAFQIRYAGYKGVVAIDPSSSMKLSLRPSMLKYRSDNTKLDVLAWTKYQPCFLNRQIIILLSTLGVRDHVFEKKQKEAVAKLNDILVDPRQAQEALSLMSPSENTDMLREMLKCGYKPDGEPFLSMMLQTFRLSKLLALRMKARIFIPQARQLMGCLDETGVLKYGQVYVRISGAGHRHIDEESLLFDDSMPNKYSCIVQGKVVVAKNPCLHPGDVRVLNAIDVTALNHMVDCIVFPQKGMRPHPNECSGSDLDGDVYFVCWDPDLIPRRQVKPMDYTPVPTKQLNHDVTIQEVQEYFTNYIIDDSLGIISNAHTVFADKEPNMALSGPCVELAKLFSIAVDFPKTGVPAQIPSYLRVKEFPDFMEKPDKTMYESSSVIGKLFRVVKDIAPSTAITIKSFTKEEAELSYDPEMEVNGYQDYVEDAFQHKTEYDYRLGNLMEYYGIKTEAEILGGGIMKISKNLGRKYDIETVAAAVMSLRHEARSWFEKGNETDNRYAKASAWYRVTYHPDYWGRCNEGLKRDHYLSFPWCVFGTLLKIKKNNSILPDIDISSVDI